MDHATNTRNKVTILEFYSNTIAIRRNHFNPLFYGGKLFQQYLVYAYARYEANRMAYIRNNQKTLRVESYKGLLDHVNSIGRDNNARVGNIFILPSTYVGGSRFMSKLYQDNMAMVRKFGRPDLFITFTCNPKWEEIKSELIPFQTSSGRPDLVTRVFRLKLKGFLDDIVKRKIFGEILAYVYVIEHQKRGLPHAHCLFTLSNEDKIKTADDVDNIISAELPNRNKQLGLYNIILTQNIHGPCGRLNPKSLCMVEGSCSKNFPKAFCNETDVSTDGYKIYSRRNNSNEAHFTRNNIQVDNHFVVPCNSFVSLKHNAHINVELCSTVKAIKYINKYITKGYDYARIGVQVNSNDNVEKVVDYDEIKQYLNCRYISSQEAAWHLQDFPIHGQSHNVVMLSIHLEDGQSIFFKENQAETVLRRESVACTTLTAYFDLNVSDLGAHQYLYQDIPNHYVFKNKKWVKHSALSYHKEKAIDREDNLVNCTINSNNLLWNDLNSDQLLAADAILKSVVDLNSQKCFYIDEPGGSGQTFLYRALIEKVNLIGKKSLIVAWTGIAATLLPGGITCHSAFSLPLDLTSVKFPRLTQTKKEFLKSIDLLIWDEASMALGTALEIVDLIFQDLMGIKTPFGGKVVVLGGDFRQVLSVIKKGSRCAIIASTIKKSSVWPLFLTFKLKRNMRAITDPDFSKWLLDIGDGIILSPPTPKNQFSVGVPISFISNDIITDIFGNSFTSTDVENFSKRSILCPRNEDVRLINERVLINLKNVEQMSFYAIDSVKNDDGAEDHDLQVNIPVEFLNTLNPSGLPPYKLNLKIGCIVMLLRNLLVNKGLCNGTRMNVRAFRQNVLQLEIITGSFSGTVHFIPRISLDTSNNPALPFNFVRHQFPVRLAYAMTINKSQGQTFDKVGLYLPEPCFSHGQFYTGCSRTTESNCLKIQVQDTTRQGKADNGQTVTDNVVY
ncbi:unnamed protein product [Rotaria sordida]|uniref:ATP-dependent DNA helicase n=1 Tax=Rotaria sordida TaxID=392033 RepID=A0A814ZRU3_9BILA|nr:unnamed protein product [Rotaria sordida]